MPLGTGPGAPEGCAPLAALSAARVHLWKGDPVSARRFFASFLNHASPVLTWQKLVGPLPGAAPDGRAGVQAARPGPDALASADCLRHLRETLVLEDGKVLRLIDGITPVDLPLGPMKVEGSATKWGKVTLALEQQDPKSWRLSFRREVVNEKEAPPLESIELPRQLQPLFNFDAATGTTALKNGPRVYIPGAATEFEVTWRNPRKG
jgi:hypothetical protein